MHASCITAFQTQTESFPTENTQEEKIPLRAPSGLPSENFVMETYSSALDSEEPRRNRSSRMAAISGASRSSSLGSSWLNWSSGSWSSHAAIDPACFTEEDDPKVAENGASDRPGAELLLPKNSPTCPVTTNNSLSRSQREFCTTLPSEGELSVDASDHMSAEFSFLNVPNSPTCSGKVGILERDNKKTGSSSGSLSSSLASSWQSVSFSKSPPSSQSSVNQKCQTLETQDGPVSPFEYVDFKPSEDPETSFLNRGVSGAETFRGDPEMKPQLLSSDSFELLQLDEPQTSSEGRDGVCEICFQGCIMGSEVLTEKDYRSLYSGVCQDCLLKRLPSRPFQLRHYDRAYGTFL